MANADSGRGCTTWRERLPWLILLRAFRPAVSLRLLLCAAAGLLVMIAGWRVCWLMFSDSNDPLIKGIRQSASRATEQTETGQVVWPAWPWEVNRFAHLGRESALNDQMVSEPIGLIPDWSGDEVRPGLRVSPEVRIAIARRQTGWLQSWASATTAQIWQLTLPFQFIFYGQIGWSGLAFSLLCGLWSLAVWSFFGGLMTRTVALKLTRDETITFTQARNFALRHWLDYFTAPLYPLCGVFLITALVAVLGLLARIGIGAVVAGVLWPLALLGGLLMALLLLGLFFGWPLMWGTVSVEGNDAFDALSRSYAYTFQRPLNYLFYGLVAAVVGTLGYLLVQFFAEGMIALSQWAASWGAGNARMEQLGDAGHSYGATIIELWNRLVRLIAAGFGISYLWSASTAIYLLLRRDVDAAEMDEIQLEQDEKFGLPPLETDARGVPGAADVPASGPPPVADKPLGEEE